MVTRTISATEAKNRFGALLKSVRDDEIDAVLVESHGEVSAVILSPEEFQKLQDDRKELQRKQWLEHFDVLVRQQAERNADLSADESEEMAIRAVRDYRRGGHPSAERS